MAGSATSPDVKISQPLDNHEIRAYTYNMTDLDKNPIFEQMPDIRLCAHANLRQATRVISQLYDKALKPAGIKATQFTILAVLANRGDVPLTKLAEILVVDRTTLTRNLQPLLKMNWIRVSREDDERVRLISLTEQGGEVVKKATPLWRTAQQAVESGIGTEMLPDLISSLNLLVETMQER